MRPFVFVRLLLVALALSACDVPADTVGRVTDVTEKTVTVRGVYALDGTPLVPSPAMTTNSSS
jgi:hypothetical protein